MIPKMNQDMHEGKWKKRIGEQLSGKKIAYWDAYRMLPKVWREAGLGRFKIALPEQIRGDVFGIEVEFVQQQDVGPHGADDRGDRPRLSVFAVRSCVLNSRVSGP